MREPPNHPEKEKVGNTGLKIKREISARNTNLRMLLEKMVSEAIIRLPGEIVYRVRKDGASRWILRGIPPVKRI